MCLHIFPSYFSPAKLQSSIVCVLREHAEDGQQSRQPPLADAHDHSRPGERHQTLAPGEEPRPPGPEGGRPRQQDGVRDLPDAPAGYQGEESGDAHLCLVIKGTSCITHLINKMHVKIINNFVEIMVGYRCHCTKWKVESGTLHCGTRCLVCVQM